MGNTEIAYSKVVLDNEQADAQLKELAVTAKKLRKELSDLKIAKDPGYAAKKRELDEVLKKTDDIKRSTSSLATVMKNLNGSSLKELSKAQRQLSSEIRNSTRNTKEEVAAIAEKSKQLKLVNAEIAKVKGLTATMGGGFMDKAAAGFNKFFTMATAGIAALTGIFFSFKNMIQGNAELSDSLADVAKTAGLTIKEVKELYKEFKNIDTRTSRKELLDLAYAAGKLGYTGKAEILGFVRAADQIGVALSKDLGGDVEQAVTDLGKLTEIFKVKGEFGIEKALLKTGSAINALGAAGTANEAYIVEFTKRVGGIAPQAGISIQQIMGLGATLDQLGQQTETSSTAISQLLVKMFAKPAEFAKIAGMSVKDFSSLLKKDANEALIALLEGLQKNKGGLQELATKFADLGVDGTRSIGVIGALSNNVDMLRTAQSLSNSEFAKGTSLTKEFNLKNENMAGNLERIKKALLSAFVNSSILNGLEKIVGWVSSWFDIPLEVKLEQERNQVNLLASQLMEANVTAETRNKLYNELKGIAPDIVDGINAEAIAYDKLRVNLEKYNQQMINQIVLARKDKEIKKMAEDASVWVDKRAEAEQKVREFMARSASHLKTKTKEAEAELKAIVDNELLTFQQKYDQFWRSINKSLAKGGNIGPVQLISLDKDKISTTYTMYLEYLAKEKAAVGEVNSVTNYRNELAKSLESSLGIVTAKTSSTSSAVKENTETIKASVKTYAELESSISNLKTQMQDMATAGTKIPASMVNELKQLEAQKKKIDETFSDGIKQLSDSFQILENKIKSLDSKIKTAIASGNTPLVEKLNLEKETAEALLKSLQNIYDQLEADNNLAALQKKIAKKIPYKGEAAASQSDLTDLNAMDVAANPDKLVGPAGHNYDVTADWEDKVKADKEKADAEKQRKENMLNAEISIATTLNDTLFSIVKSRQQAEFDHKMSLLEDQRKKELSNENLTQAEKDAINAKFDAKARKLKEQQFKKDQNASAIQAGVNGVLAVTKTFAAYGFTPAGWAAAAAQAVATLAEIAVIKSTPVPEYAKGRYSVTGTSGANYNLPYTGPAVTGIYTRPAIVGETGSEIIIDPRTTRNIQMRYPEILEAIQFARVPQFATGRYTQPPVAAKTSSVSTTASGNDLSVLADLAYELKKLRENGIETTLVYQKFKKFEDKVNDTETRAAL